MPTVFIANGVRFFFFSNEGNEPVHIHVQKAEKLAKFWMDPICLARNYKFSSLELKKIMITIEKHEDEIRRKWDDYFQTK